MNRKIFIDEVTKLYTKHTPDEFIQHLINYIKEMPLDRRHMTGDPIVSVEKVIDLCCMHFNVSLEILISRPKREELAYARQVTMYLIQTRTRMIQSRIAELFHRDHTSVSYNVRRMRDIMSVESSVREEVLRLNAQL